MLGMDICNNLNIMKKYLFIPAIFLSLSLPIHALDKYVTDDLSTYLRRGPSTQYGLSGSLKAGEKVVVLENSSDGKFTRVQDERGRTAWIESELLSDTPSIKMIIPSLEQQIETLKNQVNNASKDKQVIIDDYAQKLENAMQTINNLTNERNELKTRVNTQEKEIEALTDQVDEKRQELMLRWFTRGGLIAGAGLLLGIVLPIIVPRRRKKDRWMN